MNNLSNINSIDEQILTIIEQTINTNRTGNSRVIIEELTPEKNLSRDLGVDSLLFMELIISLESEFSIEIPFVHIETTIGVLFAFIKKFLNEPCELNINLN